MGEKVEGAKNAGEKKDDGGVTVVFKIDLHCEGCAKKVRRAAKHLPGVSDAKADSASNKLTVTGKVDPAVIKAKLEQKTKKKIEIVSPPPKKDGGGDKKADVKTEKKTDEKSVEKKADGKSEKKSDEKVEKKADEKSDKKTDEKAEKKPEDQKKPDDKKPKESTVVLKMRLHCEGCIQKIRKAIIKFKGVDEITIDAQKDLLTVKGTMEGKDLAGHLKDKFKRSVELVVPPKKEEKSPAVAGGDKKEKEAAAAAAAGGGGDKKEKDVGGAKMEVNKMEYGGYSYPASTFYYGGGSGDAQVHSSSQYSHPMEAQSSYPVHSFANSSGYYTNNENYVHQGYNAVPIYDNHHAPQFLSDENPNACSVM